VSGRRAAVAVLAALAAAVVTACGVQSDTQPRALAPDDVPFDLLAPATSSTSAETSEGVGSTVWFVDNEGLLARARRNIPPPVTVSAVLAELLAGVSDAEASNGLRTNISSGTQLLAVHGPESGLVTVDLSAEFLTVTRELQRLAVAQVVFTATGLPNVDRVLFQFAGRPAEVPGAGDELTSAPLTRAAFAQFDRTATTTTIQP
jgi:spore germination protein GerM